METAMIKQLRALHQAEPFRPFAVYLADGRELLVSSRESLASSPNGRALVVAHPDDHIEFVSLADVVDVKVLGSSRSGGNGNRSRAAKGETAKPMTIEQLRAAYEAAPFKPFLIHLADGRQVPVLSREFIMSVPSGRTIFVTQPDDTTNIIDLLLVTDLEFIPTRNGAARRRRA
jgi:hypothetical protein